MMYNPTMIYLTDIKMESIENPTITNIQKAFNALLLSKEMQVDHISLTNDSELALAIYKQTVILQDYGRFKYDGPDGPGELLSARYKEGSIFNKIEELNNLLENDEREKIMELLKSLPKPE